MERASRDYVRWIDLAQTTAPALCDYNPGDIGATVFCRRSTPEPSVRARILEKLLREAQSLVMQHYRRQRPLWRALSNGEHTTDPLVALQQCSVPVVYALDFELALNLRESTRLAQAGAIYVESDEAWNAILEGHDHLREFAHGAPVHEQVTR